MIWSPYCNNPESGFEVMPDGSMRYHKIGYPVMTLEEAKQAEIHRINGTNPHYLQQLIDDFWAEHPELRE